MAGSKTILLKVCGMRDAQNITKIAVFRPDYMGFIFYEKSPRYVGTRFSLPENFPSEIRKVGVFVNSTTDEIRKTADALGLDYVQLHGNESVEQVQELRGHGLKIIKVFSINEDFDFSKTAPFEGLVDFFLFDTKGKYYGGNGQRFDWKLLERFNQRIPFFLSGGLTSKDVLELGSVDGMNIHALDMNSGLESSPGMKDEVKTKEVIGYLHRRDD